jgi:hypothetical protein
LGLYRNDFQAAMKRPPTEAGLNLFCVNAENVEGISTVVRYFQPPFLSRLKLAIHVAEQLSGYNGGLSPSCFVIGQFLALGIKARTLIVHIEKVFRHPGECRIKSIVPRA